MSKTAPITVTGRAPVAVSKYSCFDPANPTKSKVADFAYLGDYSLKKDGTLKADWAKDGYRLVGHADITITLMPQDDMITSAVATLREQKTAVIAAAQAEATRIEGEIQKLLAIAYEAPSTTD